MSLFGQSSGTSPFGQQNNNQNQQQNASPFANSTFSLGNAAKPANPFGATQQPQTNSLFGNTNSTANPFGTSTQTQPQTSGGLFGSNANSSTPKPSPFQLGGTQPQQTNNLFGGNNTTQPQASGSLFGNNTNTQGQQSQQSGGLFGAAANSNTNTQPNAPAGGLFGGAATAQPQGNTLFGANNNTSQTQPSTSLFGAQVTSNTQGGSLFGSNAQPISGLSGSNSNSAQPQQSNSLFGGQNQAAAPAGGLFGAQNKPGSSLFGNNAGQSQPQAQRPSLFGASALGGSTQQQQPRPSLFGASANAAPTLLGGGLTMGQGNQQSQQQTVPGVKIDVSNVRGTTRFNDLHEELQKQIEQIDAFIQQQISFKEQCDALMPAHDQNLSSVPADVEFIKNELENLELTLDNDSRDINALKGVVQKDAENARVSFRAIDNLKLPQQFHYAGMWQNASAVSRVPELPSLDGTGQPANLVSFFSDSASEMSKTLEGYKQNITEIESHLRTLESSTVTQTQQTMFQRGKDGGARSYEDQMRELIAVLREFEAGILSVASRVGGVREQVHDLAVAGQSQSSRYLTGRY